MLVSHQNKFIYTKTAKTGGTSVESYFEKYCMNENEWHPLHERDEYESEYGIIGFRGKKSERLKKNPKWFHHMSAAKIKMLIGEYCWNDYFKFCVIRNPYDKLVSSFYFDAHRQGIKYNDFNAIPNFRSWLKSKANLHVDRNKYIIDNEICIDFFIRYENLMLDIEFVCKKLNIPFEPANLPNFKSGIRKSTIETYEYYDKETALIVENAYDLEFRLFNYQKLLLKT
jgi:hypothetical protein